MIIPTDGRILVKKLDREDISSESGVLLPTQTLMEESLLYGEVASEGHKKFPKGTKIFYSRYSSTKVVDKDGVQYFLLSDLDVMAIEK